MMRRKSFNLQSVIGLSALAAASPVCTIGRTDEVSRAASQAFLSKSPLNPVVQKGEKLDGDAFVYDFGTVEAMDATQHLKDVNDQLTSMKYTMTGLKHDFILMNQSDKPVTISNIESDCICTQGKLYKNDDVWKGPRIVDAGARVRIRMALDYYAIAPGPADESIRIYVTGASAPVATLTMRGQIDGGIKFSPMAGMLGAVSAGKAASQLFTLKFDRRSSTRIPPGPLRLSSSNPYVKIASVPANQNVMGVQVEGDRILFPNLKGLNFKEDVTLNFQVTLDANAPVGPIGGKIQLTVEGAPQFLLVRTAVAHLRGEVLGHLRATPLKNLVLTRNSAGVMQQRTQIICRDPLKVANLLLETSGPHLVARLIPLPPEDGTPRTMPSEPTESMSVPSVLRKERTLTKIETGEESTILEVTLDDKAPAGSFVGKIRVRNSVNTEVLELPVSAEVQMRR